MNQAATASGKDSTPSEAVSLGLRIEELERPRAKERQKEHGGTAPGRPRNTSGKLPKVSYESTRTTAVATEAAGVALGHAQAVGCGLTSDGHPRARHRPVGEL